MAFRREHTCAPVACIFKDLFFGPPHYFVRRLCYSCTDICTFYKCEANCPCHAQFNTATNTLTNVITSIVNSWKKITLDFTISAAVRQKENQQHTAAVGKNATDNFLKLSTVKVIQRPKNIGQLAFVSHFGFVTTWGINNSLCLTFSISYSTHTHNNKDPEEIKSFHVSCSILTNNAHHYQL